MIVQGLLLIDPEVRPEPGWLEVGDGVITRMEHGVPTDGADAGGADSIVCPGFYDAHVHLPQFDVTGHDGRDLLDWLDAIVFPAETRWAEPAFASTIAHRAYAALLRAGTVGYAGYLTSHTHTVEAVRRVQAELPLRAVVGQSLMDRGAPAALCGHEMAAIDPKPGPDRLTVSVNPRYAISCTPALLERAGALAAGGVMVQTHLAEQVRECALVRELYPDAPHYTGVYDRAGLLGERTLLAHCLHLDAEEWTLIGERRAVVVHCPAANTFLRSGLFDLATARDHGVRVALGTDVAAGPDVSMPRAARAMIEIAKLRAMTLTPANPVPTPAEAWRLITEGNADALGFTGAGRLALGAPADLLVLALPFPPDDDLVSRLVYTWDDGYIEDRIVNGRLIDATPASAS